MMGTLVVKRLKPFILIMAVILCRPILFLWGRVGNENVNGRSIEKVHFLNQLTRKRRNIKRSDISLLYLNVEIDWIFFQQSIILKWFGVNMYYCFIHLLVYLFLCKLFHILCIILKYVMHSFSLLTIGWADKCLSKNHLRNLSSL